jgi:hypothetical protein
MHLLQVAKVFSERERLVNGFSAYKGDNLRRLHADYHQVRARIVAEGLEECSEAMSDLHSSSDSSCLNSADVRTAPASILFSLLNN